MNRTQRGGILFKLMVLVFLAGLVFLVYLVRHPILRAAGEFWVVEDPLEHADAILLLSDDNYFADRAARTAELFRAGWAPRVVASGRRVRPYASMADLMQRDLVERGVPTDAIVRFPHFAGNTKDEALELREFVLERGWHRLLVVTSNYHTRRARYIFRRVFSPAVEVRVAAARDTFYDPDHWWETRIGASTLLHEALGYCVSIWELRRPPAPPAGLAVPGLLGSRWLGGELSVSSEVVGFTGWPWNPVYLTLDAVL